MYPTKPAEDRSEPDDFEKVLRRAIAATYLLGELKDYDALPLLNHAFMTQQGWVQSLERRWVEQAPVPPSMSLYAMHRLIARIPPDRVRPQAAAAHAAYLQFAAENIPDVIIVKGQSLKVDMIRYPPMSFRDGEDIQVGGYTKMNLTDRAWDWHARMAAFIELNFP
jgi:hypothetical protein